MNTATHTLLAWLVALALVVVILGSLISMGDDGTVSETALAAAVAADLADAQQQARQEFLQTARAALVQQQQQQQPPHAQP